MVLPFPSSVFQKNIRQSLAIRPADFKKRKKSAFSFLAAKIAVCRSDCARRPCGLVGQEKIILATLRYFFQPSLATIPGKQAEKTTRNKNAYPR